MSQYQASAKRRASATTDYLRLRAILRSIVRQQKQAPTVERWARLEADRLEVEEKMARLNRTHNLDNRKEA